MLAGLEGSSRGSVGEQLALPPAQASQPHPGTCCRPPGQAQCQPVSTSEHRAPPRARDSDHCLGPGAASQGRREKRRRKAWGPGPWPWERGSTQAWQHPKPFEVLRELSQGHPGHGRAGTTTRSNPNTGACGQGQEPQVTGSPLPLGSALACPLLQAPMIVWREHAVGEWGELGEQGQH